MKFSNPRKLAEFSDWPIGGDNRGSCRFVVEANNKGERVSRTTTDKHGRWCKPKHSTYGRKQAIVDGDDGKTYILSINNAGFISVHRHDFMSANPSAIFAENPEYLATLELINSAT